MARGVAPAAQWRDPASQSEALASWPASMEGCYGPGLKPWLARKLVLFESITAVGMLEPLEKKIFCILALPSNLIQSDMYMYIHAWILYNIHDTCISIGSLYLYCQLRYNLCSVSADGVVHNCRLPSWTPLTLS